MSLCFGTKHKILAPSSLKVFLSKVYSKNVNGTLFTVLAVELKVKCVEWN
ncbi:MAG: hypothetical protein ACJAZZ_000972 [Dokdonia donghaensis]|jgi:hypothetical protein